MALRKSLLLTVILSFVLTTAATAEDQPWGVNLTAGVVTEYMFRGKTVYEGSSFQPSATPFYDLGDYGIISGNIWAQVPTETNEPPEKFTEVDYTISYDIDIDIVTLSAGHIFYTFPGSAEGRIADTVEFYVGTSLDVVTNPTLTFYNDYDEGKYQYYTLSFYETLNHEFFGKENNIIPSALFGFAANADDGPVFYKDNGLVHIDIGLAFDIPLGELFLSPHLNYTFETDDFANNEFWFGIDLSYGI